MEILGIDIGGSGIKAAPVDVTTGTLTQERIRIETPSPATPEAVSEVVGAIAKKFEWQGAIGCTFPAIVRHGVVHSAANVDRSWVDTDGETLFRQATGCPVTLVNDGDAAGLAEVTFGAGRDQRGLIMMLTFGTGIGSALISNGQLVPNSELGHLWLWNGKEAEAWCSDRVREVKDMSWEKWARRVEAFLSYVDGLFSPDLFIIGGGVSKKHEKFLPLIASRVPVVPATLKNEAGIVGAALAANR